MYIPLEDVILIDEGFDKMDYRHRDVDFIKLNDIQYMVIACDSCGSIGLKENDLVKVPYNITGKYTARVCLMEILSVGAKPICLTANVCNEPSPTGEEIVNGIQNELSELGFDVPITISTEKNMETSMTALGITVIGLIDKNNILINKASSGDYIYTIGIPSIGSEVLENQELISDITILNSLIKQETIKEIIPVGSSGINGELNMLCESQDIKVQLIDDLQIDIYKSAGPCTVIIVVSTDELIDTYNVPVNLIGRIV